MKPIAFNQKRSPFELRGWSPFRQDISLSQPIFDSGGMCVGSSCQQRSFMPTHNIAVGPKISASKTDFTNFKTTDDYSGAFQGFLRYEKNPKASRSGQHGLKLSTQLEGGAKFDFKDYTNPTVSAIANTTTQVGYQGELYDPKSFKSYKKGRSKWDIPASWGIGVYHKKNIIGGDGGNELGGYFNFKNININIGKSKSGWGGGISIGKYL